MHVNVSGSRCSECGGTTIEHTYSWTTAMCPPMRRTHRTSICTDCGRLRVFSVRDVRPNGFDTKGDKYLDSIRAELRGDMEKE